MRNRLIVLCVIYIAGFVIATAVGAIAYRTFIDTVRTFKDGGEGYWTSQEVILGVATVVLYLLALALCLYTEQRIAPKAKAEGPRPIV